MSAVRQGYLARWIPTILIGAFLLDAALHFVRLDFLAFRCDEMVSQVVPPGFRFEPGRSCRMDRASGDIASIANVPEYRVVRPQVFTTDRFGFRNAPQDVGTPPSVLLLGSSFTVGTGNSDGQTLARRLESLSGCSVYNAGGWGRVIADTRAFIRRLGMRHGLVLMEFLERDAWGRPIAMESGKPRFRYSPLIWWYYDQTTRSRLKIISQRIFKYMLNDRILPNLGRSGIAVRELLDGRPMLFFLDAEPAELPTTLEPHLRGIERLRDALREDGHRLGVYLIPEKLTVYRDLLQIPVTRAALGASVLAEAERGVRALGIPTVNFEPALHEGAQEALGRGEVIYWPDDTHWNPRGIEIAAREINRAFELPASCRLSKAKD